MTVVWVGTTAGQGALTDGVGLSAMDHGLTVGDGAFETCKLTHGTPFALTRHLRRLDRSLATLELQAAPHDVVRQVVEDVIARLSADEGGAVPFGRLRITVTAGAGPLGSERGSAEQTLVVAATPAAPWGPVQAVATVPWVRNERSAVAGVKTTSYAENVVALRAAHRAGAGEALLANTRDELCEGTGSNVIVLHEGRLVTPTLGSGCLAGISRALLLEWATKEGLDVVEADLPYDVLSTAEDVLLTSSTRDVQQIQFVDGRPVPGSSLGRAAVELFAAQEAVDPDPA